MQIEEHMPYLETLLLPWKKVVGDDYQGYRNHVYRMLHCCFALHDCDAQSKQKLMIAGAFHDIGLWTESTLDYIAPSVHPALAYLEQEALADWSEEISLMISEHHKITPFTDKRYPLVEVFRKADLVDFSRGLVRFGLSKPFLNALKSSFPNAGFHAGLVRKAGRWCLKHPLRPVPMMKW